MIPKRGSFEFPGRHRLSERERVLLEARTFKELLELVGTVPCDEGLDSVLGFLEYLHMDWLWLHDPAFRESSPDYRSYHAYMLRTSEHYRAEIAWRGPLPDGDESCAFIESLRN